MLPIQTSHWLIRKVLNRLAKNNGQHGNLVSLKWTINGKQRDCKQSHNDPHEKKRNRANQIIIQNREDLIVGSTADDFFACWSQKYSVLKLGCIAALGIAEGRIRIYDPFIAEVLQGHQVLGLVQPIKPASTKGQCTKVLVDDIQQLLRLG